MQSDTMTLDPEHMRHGITAPLYDVSDATCPEHTTANDLHHSHSDVYHTSDSVEWDVRWLSLSSNSCRSQVLPYRGIYKDSRR